jgi:hypothetical protein
MHATAAWQLVSSSLSTITWIQERLVKLVNTTHGGKGQRFRSFYSVTSGIRCSTNDDETRILLHRINSMGQTWRICGENIMRSEHTDEEGLDNYYSEGRCISPSTTSTSSVRSKTTLASLILNDKRKATVQSICSHALLLYFDGKALRW